MKAQRAVRLLLVLTVALAGCAERPAAPPAEEASAAPEEGTLAEREKSPAEGAEEAVRARPAPAPPPGPSPAPPEKPREMKEPEKPEPPPGPPGRLVVHARGDVGVSVHREGRKVADGKALIPFDLAPGVYTVKVHPPGLPEAEAGEATVFSEKTTEFEVTGYGELWVHTSEPGARAELTGASGEKVAEGRTCDFWLVPAGTFTVRTTGAELKGIVVESGKRTAVAVREPPF